MSATKIVENPGNNLFRSVNSRNTGDTGVNQEKYSIFHNLRGSKQAKEIPAFLRKLLTGSSKYRLYYIQIGG
jgi:hypothetical protein